MPYKIALSCILMNQLFVMDAPLIHIFFVVLFAMSVGTALLFFLTSVMQKSEKWSKRAFLLLVFVGAVSIGVAITGVKSALEVDFSNPLTTNFMYVHILSGAITVAFTFYVAYFAFTQFSKRNESDKKIVTLIVILLGLLFLTLSLGKSVLETGAAQHKEEVLYGPPR